MSTTGRLDTASNAPVVAMITLSVWVCSFGGWLFGMSGSAFFLWGWALAFAAASLWMSRGIVNLVFLVLGLALGPGLYAGLVVWFGLAGAEA